MTDVVWVAIITGSSGLIGAAIGSGATLLAARNNSRVEERKHLRELGVQVAMLKFGKEEEMLQKISDATGKALTVPPFSVFVVDGIRMMEIVGDKSITSSEVGRRLMQLNKFTDGVIAEIKKQNTQPDA